MNSEERIKLFGMSLQMLERDLDLVESKYGLDLGREHLIEINKDEQYYLQFKAEIRQEAAIMSRHYELFYALERSIRELVIEKLEADHGANWWDSAIPDPIKDNVEKNIKRELESGVTRRSDDKLDYTTFGELGDIVRHNWPTFSDTFNNEKAFGKIMASLNILRAPIAHCCPLAPDEVVRLQLTLKDWFRLME